ncbi:MAG: tetratricopeptide repeat protein [Cyanobacteria bacterium P01_E01_bin.6]
MLNKLRQYLFGNTISRQHSVPRLDADNQLSSHSRNASKSLTASEPPCPDCQPSQQDLSHAHSQTITPSGAPESVTIESAGHLGEFTDHSPNGHSVPCVTASSAEQSDSTRSSPASFPLPPITSMSPEAAISLADSLWSQGNQEDALVYYRHAVHAAPTLAIAHQALAQRLEAQGRLDEAVVHYRQTLELSPLRKDSSASPPLDESTISTHAPISAAIEAEIDQAETLCQHQQWDEAIALCTALVTDHPHLAIAHKLLGTALQANGDLPGAHDHYNTALQIRPQWAEVYVNLGNLHARQEQWDDAVQNYQQAIALKPHFAGAYRNLAKVWSRQNHHRLAAECRYHALQLEPDTMTLQQIMALGNDLLKHGHPRQATDCYRRVIDVDATVPGVHLNLAEALAQQEEWQEAVTVYRKAAPFANLSQNSATPPLSSETLNGNGASNHHASMNGKALSAKTTQDDPSGVERIHQKQQAQHHASQGQWQQAIALAQQELRHIESEAATFYHMMGAGLKAEGHHDEAIQCYRKLAMMQPESADVFANLGSLYAVQKQWQPAIKAYQRAIALNPGFAGAYRNLARVWEQTDDIQAASECWYHALSLEPNWATASNHVTLGKTLTQQGQLDWAMNCYQHVLQIDDDFAEAHERLAALLQQTGQQDEAIVHYRKTIQLQPKHGDAYMALGSLLTDTQHWQEALHCYQQVIQIEPKALRGYIGLCDLFVQHDQIAEAIPYYQTLAALQPDSSTAYHELGDALNQVQRWEEAIPVFQRAIQLQPDFSWSHNNLGDALLKLERWDDAAAAFRQSIALNPHFVWSYYNLGDALCHLEDWDGALDAYRQVLEQESNLPYVHQKLGDVLKKRANADMGNALFHYDQEIQQNPAHIDSYHKRLELKKDDPDLYVQLANALVRQGERTEAIVACQMGLQVQPSHLDLKVMLDELTQHHGLGVHLAQEETQSQSNVHPDESIELEQLGDEDPIHEWSYFYELGNQFQVQGKLDAAILAYGKAIAQNPSHSWSHHQLGDTYLKQEKWSDAVSAYSQAIALNTDYFWSHYNLGVAYTRQGKWNDAIRAYRHSIDQNPGLNLPCLALRDTLLKQWDALLDKGDALLRSGDRDAAQAFYHQAIRNYQERLYLQPLERTPAIPPNPSVLLIADDVLPQCFHYRVQQKLEQLEEAGFLARYVSKDDVDTARNALHFCHVVIFYRVPALPHIIETIQYAKNLGKVIFYEIDDLIFDEINYPAPFETYGGRISIDEYYGLSRDATLFREAMALCDYAIASTPALVTAMETIVSNRTAFLHRNALDYLNAEFVDLSLPKIKREYLSIFYGSGTKAHDTDFNQLAAPALVRIFEQYSDVRLTLVGYVSLPEILEPYSDRIDRVDLIREVEIYWELLYQADINIAVLKATRETNCKSEIKWLEAAALGIPSVVSATQTYTEVLTHGVDGFLASTSDEWFGCLDTLIRDEDLRHTMAEQAKVKAWSDYGVPTMAQNIRHIIQTTIVSLQSEQRHTSDLDLQHNGNGSTPSSHVQKKKLLIVNVFYPPQSIGGATRIVKDNVKVLAEQYGDRYDISVFTTDHDYPVPYRITEYTHNRIPVTKVSTPLQEGMDWQYENPKMYEIFQEYLRFNRPDLIHFHCVQRLTGSVLEAAYDLRIPYVVTVHDAWWISDHQFLVNEEGVECSYQQNDPLVTALDSKDVGRSLKRCRYLQQQLNHAEAILAVSETFAEIYRQNGFPQTKANRNGIMPRSRLPRKPNPTGKVRFAHVGGMSAHKGYYLFKEAVEIANLTNSEVIVVDHAQTVGSTNHGQWGNTPVTFIAKVPQDKMHEFYSTIDVLVAPSMWPESFGLVTREATAAGVWVIASNKGALAEDLEPGKNSTIVSTGENTQLIAILQHIDQNSDKYQNLLTDTFFNRSTAQQVQELSSTYEHIDTISDLQNASIKFQ